MITLTAVEFKSEWCGVATDKRQNIVYSVESKEVLEQWRGKEITAAAAFGDRIICAALDGRVYVVGPSGIQELKHQERSTWVHAVTPLAEGRFLLGGTLGRLLTCDVNTGQFHNVSLAAHGIPKPGRAIYNFVPNENETFIIGNNGLLVKYNGQDLTLMPSAPRSETSFNQGAITGDILWIVGRQLGPKHVLVKIDLRSNDSTTYELATRDHRLPAIAAIDGNIYLGDHELRTGMPNAWRVLGDFGENSIVKIFKARGQVGKIQAVGYTGRTMAFGDNTASTPC